MGRLADVLYIGFAIRPEWNTAQPVHWSNIHAEVFTSRQVEQIPGWEAAVSKIGDDVCKEFGVSHISYFHQKLSQITPNAGHCVDSETGSQAMPYI